MAQWARAGHFTLATALNGTVDVTGLPGTPAFVLFWWSGRTETSDAVGAANAQRGFGWAASASARTAIGSGSVTGGGSSATDNIYRTDACIATVTSASGVDGLGDYSTLSDGFRITTDDAFPSAYRVSYLAVGGDGITVTTGIASEPASPYPATTDVTVSGFASGAGDQFVLFSMIASGAAANALGTQSRVSFGFAGSNGAGGIAQCAWTGGGSDAAATMVTRSYCKSGQCIAAHANPPGASLTTRTELTAWLTNGFRLNVLEGSGDGARDYNWLAVKGISNKVVSLLTQTNTTTDITISSLSGAPLGAFYLSNGKAESTDDAPANDDKWSMGAADGTNEVAQAILDENGTANAEVTTAIRHSDVYANLSTSSTIDGAMGVTAWGSNSITHRMSDADPSQAFIGALVLIESVSTVNGSATIAAGATVTGAATGTGAMSAAISAGASVSANLTGRGSMTAAATGATNARRYTAASNTSTTATDSTSLRSPATADAITICGWFKRNGSLRDYALAFGKLRTDNNDYTGIAPHEDSTPGGRVRGVAQFNSFGAAATPTVNISDNTWYFGSVRWGDGVNGSVVTLRILDESRSLVSEVSSSAVSSDTLDLGGGNDDFAIGGVSPSSSTFMWNGDIAYVRMYASYKTNAELLDIANSTAADTGAVLDFALQGSGGTETDRSGDGNNGTHNNSPSLEAGAGPVFPGGTVGAAVTATGSLIVSASAVISVGATVTGSAVGNGAVSSAIAAGATVGAALLGNVPASAVLSAGANVAAAIDGRTPASAALEGGAAVSGALLGNASGSSALSAGAAVAGSALGNGAASAAVSAGAAVAGTLLGNGATSAALSGGANVSATLAAAASASAAVTAGAAVVASLSGNGAMSGASTATGTVTGAMVGAGAMAATLTAGATVTGTGTAAGDGEMSAAVSVGAAVSASLLGNAAGSSATNTGAAVTAALVGNGALAGTLTAGVTVTATGSAAGASDISATIAVGATVSANLVGRASGSAVLVAGAAPSAALTATVNASATISAGATCTAAISATGAMVSAMTAGAAVAGSAVGRGSMSAVVSAEVTVSASVNALAAAFASVTVGTSSAGVMQLLRDASSAITAGASVAGGLGGSGALVAVLTGGADTAGTAVAVGSMFASIAASATVSATGLAGGVFAPQPSDVFGHFSRRADIR